MSRSTAMGDMLAIMEEKYRLMGQDTERAQKDRALQAIGINAAANLDNVKAKLMPGESAAEIALKDQTRLYTKEQTDFYGKIANANIEATRAGTANTIAGTRNLGIQGDILKRRGLTPLMDLLGGDSFLPQFQVKVSGRGGGYRDIDMRSIRGGL